MRPANDFPRIGLALGGGGARGLAHIAVLEAFDDLGIRPHRIAGTSIGAIMGAAYASGLTGGRIREIALETFGDRNAVLQRLWQLRPKRVFDLFRQRPMQLDPARVLEAFVAEHLPHRFEELEIPLRISATDYYACQEVAFQHGPLLPAISASIAIPALFRPVRHGDRILVDGGAVNPLPYETLVGDCDFVVAVDVVGTPTRRDGNPPPGVLDAIFGTSQILMQTITNEKLKTVRPDILLSPESDSIRILDFMKVKQILEKSANLREAAGRELSITLGNSKHAIMQDIIDS